MVELSGLKTATPKGEGTAFLCDATQAQAFATSQLFKPGQVLVARMTNPGMMSMIRNSSAVVCEIGGLTSHAVIVCKDYSKPCVVGVKGLLDAVRNYDGERPLKLVVDGETGKVVIRGADES